MIVRDRKTGVSAQAVSAVLNHPESCRISSKVQEEIRRIAAELGTTERAVEGRLYRIRKKLQKQLGGDVL